MFVFLHFFSFFDDLVLQFYFSAVGIASRAHAAHARVFMRKSKHEITVKRNKR